MSYKLKLDVFEGPLDLLLYLIKKNDLDIKDIPIASITEQYLQYIDMMKLLDLDVVGDFLVMAATLMQIKSKMLLPPDPSEVEVAPEDPRDELVRRLQEYQQFKEIAENLKLKEQARQDLFARHLDPATAKSFVDDAKEVYFEATLFDLISALTTALKRAPEEIMHEIIKEEFTIEKKIHDILHLLLEHPTVQLAELFGKAKGKMEIIVTFMAVLELIRLREIVAVQKRIFEDIMVMRNRENLAPPESSSEIAEGEQVTSEQITNESPAAEPPPDEQTQGQEPPSTEPS